MRYRIFKYDPQNSVNHVIYSEEWTSLYDVGKIECFTLQEYLYYELLYIKTIAVLIKVKPDYFLNIEGFEPIPQLLNQDIHSEVKDLISKDYKCETYISLYTGNRLFDISELNQLLKIMLREEAWFKITFEEYTIYSGYDYYLHVDSECPLVFNQKEIPSEIHVDIIE